ncbi:MAG: HNH endonuclease [Candidatus Binatus sp.]|uniref:HNH endonuclease n=1 Tax=Candidatus Binatus sp. TaxID=2811406 RepID=UPI002717DB1D|nr:HNH endonuclease [Candidatus Binatus sp.]MDO8431098.1 HNH endonuclease [Candidatus Binatus sp.]
MIQPEDPPGFIVRTEAQKAASNNGYRLIRGIEGGWLCFASTTAKGQVWIASVSKSGPWLLSIGRPEVGAEIELPSTSATIGPGAVTFVFDNLEGLYGALDRVYRLGLSLPDVPFANFRAAVQNLSRATEIERLVIQRIGQDVFRQALMNYWGGRCPLSGITDTALLRASHIVPWAECATDEQRLDVHNGLLLSALWDSAFDAGLITFEDDGLVLFSPELSAEACSGLGLAKEPKLSGLTSAHRLNLKWHRARYAPRDGWMTPTGATGM